MKSISKLISVLLVLTLTLGLLPGVGMKASARGGETITITWNSYDFTSDCKGKDGISTGDAWILKEVDEDTTVTISLAHYQLAGTFSTTLGNFTKIAISGGDPDSSSDFTGNGWTGGRTWEGNASSVPFDGCITDGINNSAPWSITFTIKTPVIVDVTGLSLTPNSANLTFGGTQTLTATVSPDNATNKSVTWSSDDPSVATVSDAGVVTAVGVGSAIITATATNGTNDTSDDKTATCAVTVSKANNPMTFSSQTVEKTFSTASQTAEITPAANAQGDVTYSIKTQKTDSGDEVTYFSLSGTTLTIAANTPAGEYYVAVNATTPGNNNYKLSSKLAVVTVKVNKANSTPATITPNNRTYDGTEKPLVTVDNSAFAGGEMQYALGSETEATGSYATSIPNATDAGTYYVWYKAVGNANYNDSSADKVTVTISKADPETPDNLSAKIGQTLADVTLPEGWTWADSTLSVGEAGDNTFKANFAGNDNYNSASDVDVVVTVSIVPVTGVTVSPDTLDLIVGDTVELTAAVEPSDASNKNVTWSSSNEDVAVVFDGFVTAVSDGTAEITVTTEDGKKKAVCTVIAVYPFDDVDFLAPPTIDVGDSDTVTLRITKDGKAVEPEKVEWSVDDESILTVDQNGNVKGIKEGTATVTAIFTINNVDYYNYAEINVTKPNVEITLDAPANMEAGQTAEVKAAVKRDGKTIDSKVTWVSEDESIATVDKDGKVTAVAPGTAKITAKTTVAGITFSKSVEISVVEPETVLPEFKLTSGAGGKHVKGEDGTLTFTFKNPEDDEKTFDYFDGTVTVKGKDYNKVLDKADFKAEKGSLKVTLTADYLNTLKPGDYTLTAQFNVDGVKVESESVKFTVKPPKSAGNTPKTSGASYIVIIIAFMAAMAYITFYVSKKSLKPALATAGAAPELESEPESVEYFDAIDEEDFDFDDDFDF